MTETDWRELIDSSFGAGPEPELTVSDTVAAGRRALRRRRARLAVLAGAGLTVVALAIPSTLGLHGVTATPDRGGLQPADSGQRHVGGQAEVGKATATLPIQSVATVVTYDGPLRYDAATHTITTPSGWTVLSQRNDVAGPGSAAAEVSDGTTTMYVAYFGPGSEHTGVVASSADLSFSAFVDSLARLSDTTQVGP
jgi:hypothetical protein